MSHDWIIAACGIGIGFLSGLFGMAGSSVSTPVLRMLDVPRFLALASPLPVSLPTGLAGGVAYWRRGFVQARTVFWTVLGGLPTVALGAYLTTVIPGRVLMVLSGLFVVLAGLRVLLKRLPSIDQPLAATSPLLLLGIGVTVGFLSGLLANGGGFLLVPAYIILCHATPAQAAANSLVSAAILSIPDTWVHWRLGHIDPHLVLLLSAGVLPAAYLGGHLGATLRPTQTRWLFGGFLVLFGVFFLLRTLYRAEVYGWSGLS